MCAGSFRRSRKEARGPGCSKRWDQSLDWGRLGLIGADLRLGLLPGLGRDVIRGFWAEKRYELIYILKSIIRVAMSRTNYIGFGQKQRGHQTGGSCSNHAKDDGGLNHSDSRGELRRDRISDVFWISEADTTTDSVSKFTVMSACAFDSSFVLSWFMTAINSLLLLLRSRAGHPLLTISHPCMTALPTCWGYVKNSHNIVFHSDFLF